MNHRGPQTNTVWTAEMIADLKRLVGDRWSAARIGVKLKVSRSVVTRKVRRLGLKLMGDTDPGYRRENGRRTALMIKGSARNPVGKLPSAPPKPLPTLRGGASLCTFVTLKASSCRWPLGEPSADMPCCGAPRTGDGPYCAEHQMVASGGIPARRMKAPHEWAPGTARRA